MVVIIGYAFYGGMSSNILVSTDTLYNSKSIQDVDRTSEYRHLPTLMKVLHPWAFGNVRFVNNIILENLYQLHRIRNIELYEFMTLINGSLVTSNGDVLLPAVKEYTQQQYYDLYYLDIHLINKTYPGLFAPVYTPEYWGDPIGRVHLYLVEMVSSWIPSF
jgi:hypothetical protein